MHLMHVHLNKNCVNIRCKINIWNSLVEIGSVVLEKKIFKFCQCIFAILLLSPLRKGRGPSFEQTWIPFTQGCFVSSLVEIDPVVLEKKIFKFLYFRYFVIIFPWKRAGPFIWTNLNPYIQECFVLVWLKLAQWFWEEDENVKSLRQCKQQQRQQRQRLRTDKLWSEKLPWAFGSGELKTYVNSKAKVLSDTMFRISRFLTADND